MSAACVASPAHKLATNFLARRLYSPPIGRELRVGPPLAGQHLVPARLSLQWMTFASRRSSRRWAGVVVPGEGVDGSVQRDGLGGPSLDAVFSFVEVICIAPPAIGSFIWIMGLVLPSTSKQFHMSFGSRVFILQFALLVGAVVVGAIIRQRQWQRLCRDNDTGTDLIARIEKVEEDLRSSATIIRVLSRQLEKLGIRFRVTRKSLKEPISETAVLAQKNSEATRALAMQEDILEKELGEIQKVLLAMQEQQQKQLELILAIGKAGRLLESKWDALEEQDSSGARNSIPQKKVVNQVEIQTGRPGANDNKSQGY